MYTHSALHQGRQVDRLSVHRDLRTNSFCTNNFLQFDFSALPSLTAEVRQCGRRIVSIVCFTIEILVNINILPFAHCYSTSNGKYFLKRKIFLPVFSPRELFILLSYRWRLCFIQLFTMLLVSLRTRTSRTSYSNQSCNCKRVVCTVDRPRCKITYLFGKLTVHRVLSTLQSLSSILLKEYLSNRKNT